MSNMSLGGGGRFAAYAAKHGYAAAKQHCIDKYGKEGCEALHKHGTKAAPYARAAEKSKNKKDFPSFEEFSKDY